MGPCDYISDVINKSNKARAKWTALCHHDLFELLWDYIDKPLLKWPSLNTAF